MKAIILAGGKGTRIRDISKELPKALLPIKNKTLTEHVISILKKYKVDNIYLSVAYKKEKVIDYFNRYKDKDLTINYIEEPEPLGTAGPLIILKKEKKEFKENFFMINGDNLFDLDLDKMLNFHKKNKAKATIALSKVKDPTSYGVAVLDDNDRITEFIEKPKNPYSDYINSGYYILEPEVFDLIKKNKAMMEKDIFPILAKEKKLYGFKYDGLWFDTGTPERYEQVKKEWRLS